MKITTITYACLTYTGNRNEYEKLEASIDIEGEDNPDIAFQQLREFVLERSSSGDKHERLIRRISDKKCDLLEIENKVTKAQERWNQTAEFLRAQGIRPDAPDFPFTFPPALPQSQEPEEVDADLDNTPF